MLRVGILAAGGGTNLQAIIDAVESGRITDVELSFVLSNKPGVRALERARAHGIKDIVVDMKSFADREDFNQKLSETIDAENPDLIVLAGFMTILDQSIIRAYHNQIINVHPSLIPSFCGEGFYGLRVHEAALARGVKFTGATVHFVNEVADDGPIILQQPVAVFPDDTPEVLQKRVMEQAEWQILPQAVNLFCNGQLEVREKTVFIKQ